MSPAASGGTDTINCEGEANDEFNGRAYQGRHRKQRRRAVHEGRAGRAAMRIFRCRGANSFRPERAVQECRRALRRSEEHTSELQSHSDLVCRLLLEKKKK